MSEAGVRTGEENLVGEIIGVQGKFRRFTGRRARVLEPGESCSNHLGRKKRGRYWGYKRRPER